MIVTLKGSWSEAGGMYDLDRFNLPAGAEEIASWLSDDVVSMNGAKEWIERLTPLALSGDKSCYLGMGNAHHVNFAKGMIFLECEFVERLKVLIDINALIRFLNDYLTFRDNAFRGKDLPPEPLLVEYVAEGQAAKDFYPWAELPVLVPSDYPTNRG